MRDQSLTSSSMGEYSTDEYGSTASMVLRRSIRHLPVLVRGLPLRTSGRYRPFFIVGSGRCGTTLLRAILDAHPDVHIPPETYALPQAIKDFKRYSRLPWPVLLKIILADFEYHPRFSTFDVSLRNLYSDLLDTPAESRALAWILNRFYLYHASSVKPGASRWGDKTPLNTFFLPQIHSVFPDATFIHMIRDGRDVVRSIVEAGLGSFDYAIERWISAVRVAQEFGSKNPRQYIEIRYENLVTNVEEEIVPLCSALDLTFDSCMLEHHTVARDLGDVTQYAHLSNAREPITMRHVGKWRQAFDSRQLRVLERRLGPTMDRLDYGGGR